MLLLMSGTFGNAMATPQKKMTNACAVGWDNYQMFKTAKYEIQQKEEIL